MQLIFNDNPNGKLFLDIFSDIRIADSFKFSIGNEMEVVLRNKPLGFVKVVGYKEFSFKRLTDTLAHVNCGRSAVYQAKLLNSYYSKGGALLQPDTTFYWVVFKWTTRNLTQQSTLLEDFWKTKMDEQSHIPNSQNLFQ